MIPLPAFFIASLQCVRSPPTLRGISRCRPYHPVATPLNRGGREWTLQ